MCGDEEGGGCNRDLFLFFSFIEPHPLQCCVWEESRSGNVKGGGGKTAKQPKKKKIIKEGNATITFMGVGWRGEEEGDGGRK